MGEYDNRNNDPQTSDSNSAQNAGNTTSQSGQQQQGQNATGQSGAGYGDQGGQGATGQSGSGSSGVSQGGQQADGGFANDDESRGGPPTGEQLGDDTGGLTSDQGARSGQGGMQQDALGSASGSDLEDDGSDNLQDQNSSGAV